MSEQADHTSDINLTLAVWVFGIVLCVIGVFGLTYLVGEVICKAYGTAPLLCACVVTGTAIIVLARRRISKLTRGV